MGGAIRGRRAFTLMELAVVMAIIAILALIAVGHFGDAKIRSEVAATKSNLRILGDAMQVYQIDHNAYPYPQGTLPDDPFGVIAQSALTRLTTPISYLSSLDPYTDPFGAVRMQGVAGGSIGTGLPIVTLNPNLSILYIHYPRVATLIVNPEMDRAAFSLISLGPDRLDSFILFAPFPDQLPEFASDYGLYNISDTIYDPTNGTRSMGDIARFEGDLSVAKSLGGGAQ